MPHPVPQFSLRAATTADASFCFTLYASTRAEEMSATGWPAAQREAFLRQQFTARTEGYRSAFPGATHSVIVVDRKPVGALVVHRTHEEIRLVDIALLPARRGRGLGSCILQKLIEEARTTQLPLRLQVLKNNPAQQLYLRLGFAPTGENGLYFKLEWRGSSAGT
jgi:GNAT superfamily N-acetyltransferase